MLRGACLERSPATAPGSHYARLQRRQIAGRTLPVIRQAPQNAVNPALVPNREKESRALTCNGRAGKALSSFRRIPRPAVVGQFDCGRSEQNQKVVTGQSD